MRSQAIQIPLDEFEGKSFLYKEKTSRVGEVTTFISIVETLEKILDESITAEILKGN